MAQITVSLLAGTLKPKTKTGQEGKVEVQKPLGISPALKNVAKLGKVVLPKVKINPSKERE